MLVLVLLPVVEVLALHPLVFAVVDTVEEQSGLSIYTHTRFIKSN